MVLMSLVVAAVVAADPCEAPRLRDTAPLVAAMAQDKVLGLTFTKAAGICAERGEACEQVRLECATMLNSTIQKQVGFDEGQWLRDMLLPYNGASYPMTRSFGAAGIASDASCNVDVATLTAAAQRRMVQSTRRDAIFQEYNLYARWAQAQLQKCKEQVASNEARSAQAKAESERLAATSAAVGAAEVLRLKQAADLAAAKSEAEKHTRDVADAELRRQKDQKDLAERELKKREENELRLRDEREQERKRADEKALKADEERKKEKVENEETRKKEKAEAEEARKKDKAETEQKLKDAKDEAARSQKELEAKRLVTERDNRVNQQKALKTRLVADAEANFKRAQDEEVLKKQAAVDAVSSSPAIAQAAVADAAQAERGRVEAEKRLFEARQKAAAIVIDDSFERAAGSILVAVGGSGLDTGFGLGVMASVHFGFWGVAPQEGLASGFELRLWGRFLGGVSGGAQSSIDTLLTGRYFFGPVAVGVAGEIRLLDPALTGLRAGVGPALAVAFIDTHETRVILAANYLPLGNPLDAARFVGDFEVSYKIFTLHVNGGTATKLGGLSWQIGAYAGVRATW